MGRSLRRRFRLNPDISTIPLLTPHPRPDDTMSNQRQLPDPEICRTRYMGKSLGFTDCLVENPNGCPFAVILPSCVSCFDPDRQSFDATVHLDPVPSSSAS